MVSAETMRLLSSVRRGAEDDGPVLGLKPNQIASTIGAAARQAGLGEGYLSRAARRCSTAAAESCTTGTMRKN